MSSSGEYSKSIFQKKLTDSVSSRENNLGFPIGRTSASKNRPDISSIGLTRQFVIETNLGERIKFKGKDPTKTATEFFSNTKKRSSSNERDLWTRYGLKSNSTSKKPRDDRRASSALRGASILRSRIERDISMSEDAQELFDEGILEESKPNPIQENRNKRFLLQSDVNRDDFDHHFPTFSSPEKGRNENMNVRSENIAPGKLSSKPIIMKIKTNSASKNNSSREHLKVSFGGSTNENEEPPQKSFQIKPRPRDTTPIRVNLNASSYGSNPNEVKKLTTGEERKKRINALERYVDNNYGDNSKLSSSESRNDLDDSNIQPEEPQKKLNESEPFIPPNKVAQNFRKKLYVKSATQEEGKNNDSSMDLSRPKEKLFGIQSQLITSFDKDFENIQSEQLDVEEIHYFFVNFHQKSKLLLSKMK